MCRYLKQCTGLLNTNLSLEMKRHAIIFPRKKNSILKRRNSYVLWCLCVNFNIYVKQLIIFSFYWLQFSFYSRIEYSVHSKRFKTKFQWPFRSSSWVGWVRQPETIRHCWTPHQVVLSVARFAVNVNSLFCNHFRFKFRAKLVFWMCSSCFPLNWIGLVFPVLNMDVLEYWIWEHASKYGMAKVLKRNINYKCCFCHSSSDFILVSCLIFKKI